MILADQIESYVYLTGMDTRWKVPTLVPDEKEKAREWLKY